VVLALTSQENLLRPKTNNFDLMWFKVFVVTTASSNLYHTPTTLTDIS